jgi:hypothetical protein
MRAPHIRTLAKYQTKLKLAGKFDQYLVGVKSGRQARDPAPDNQTIHVACFHHHRGQARSLPAMMHRRTPRGKGRRGTPDERQGLECAAACGA